jgi:hypothetical protein
MTTAQLFIVCTTVLLLALGAGVLTVLPSRMRPAPSRARHRVTVHLRDDVTIAGTLLSEHEDWLVLADAEYVTPAGPQPIRSRETRLPVRDLVWLDVYDLVAPAAAPRAHLAPAPPATPGHERIGAVA